MCKYISTDIYVGILMVLSIILVLYLIGLIRNISLVNRKRRLQPVKVSSTTEQDKLDYSIGVINLINNIIDIEITGFLKSYIVLGTTYNVINLDKDVETVSKTVFESIKSETYMNDTILLSDNYIMSYITKNVSYVLIVKSLSINNKLRELE